MLVEIDETVAAPSALRFPDIELKIATEDRAMDMVEEGCDLVLRVDPTRLQGCWGLMFPSDRLVVVARRRLKPPPGEAAVTALMRGGGFSAASSS